MLKMQVIGHLGADAKVIKTENAHFFTFSVAALSKKSEQTPQWVECSQRIKGDEAPSIVKYLKKGQLVYVDGSPYSKAYKAEGDEIKAQLSIFIDDITLLGGRSEEKEAKEK